MATKRRKVWVNFYEDGSNDGCAFGTKGDAKENASTAYVMTQVPFTERRPGDVVLSREEQNAVADGVARELVAEGYDEDDAPMIAGVVVRALLRGRR